MVWSVELEIGMNVKPGIKYETDEQAKKRRASSSQATPKKEKKKEPKTPSVKKMRTPYEVIGEYALGDREKKNGKTYLINRRRESHSRSKSDAASHRPEPPTPPESQRRASRSPSPTARGSEPVVSSASSTRSARSARRP